MNRLDEVLETLPMARQYTKYVSGLCPFHEDHNPSLLVYETGFFCTSCRKKGTVDQLLLKLRASGGGLNKQHIARQEETYYKPDWKRWFAKYDTLEGIVEHAHGVMQRSSVAQEYLNKRKVLDVAVQDFAVGYLDKFFTFPVFNFRGDLVSMVVRVDPRFIDNPKNRRYFILPKTPLHMCFPEDYRNKQYLCLAFGIFDMLTLNSFGIPAVASVAGKNFKPELLNFWRKSVYLLPDKGEERDASAMVKHFGWRGRVFLPPYKDKEKDLNDMHVNGTISPFIKEIMSYGRNMGKH